MCQASPWPETRPQYPPCEWPQTLGRRRSGAIDLWTLALGPSETKVKSKSTMLENFVSTPSELEFKDHNLLLTKEGVARLGCERVR